VENTFCCNLDNGNMLREVVVKIGLERIDIYEGATELVMSSEFAKKQEFKLKKIVNIYYQGHRERTEIIGG